jgi:ribosomal protein S12 methylthiotransferase
MKPTNRLQIVLISLGCDKNLVDSEKMLGKLDKYGYAFTDDKEEAQIAIVNTCCFIHDAKEESVNALLELADLKTEGKLQVLVAAGCLAQRYREDIQREIPEVDAVMGTMETESIVKVIQEVLDRQGETEGRDSQDEQEAHDLQGEQDVHDLQGEQEAHDQQDEHEVHDRQDEYEVHDRQDGLEAHDYWDELERLDPQGESIGSLERSLTTGGHYAYLKIAEGCDKHCTYCVIPSVRGKYRSVPMEELVTEAEQLVACGVKELILVAQETTRYGMDCYGEKKLPQLLRRLAQIPDLVWIRLLYCYPEEITEELIEVMAEEPKICHYLDIPIQHASDEILKRMGRQTTRADIEQKIQHLRERIPDICLRTTLITGFPGERAQDHEILIDFVGKMKFDRLGVFTYSREEGTPAAIMPGQVAERVKRRRRKEIMLLQQEIAFAKAKEMEGTILPVMVEGKAVDEDIYVTRTYGDAPEVDGYLFLQSQGNYMTGDFVQARVIGANAYDLVGEDITELEEEDYESAE